jgi:hypothetical protein
MANMYQRRRVSTFNNPLSSVLRRPLSVFRPPANCPSCRLAAQSETFFEKTNPNLLDSQRLQILFVQRLTKAKVQFRHQENEPNFYSSVNFATLAICETPFKYSIDA